MKIHAIICPWCNDTIYSRAHHDFHWCSCKKTFIDGGFDYIRCGWTEPKPPPINIDIEVDATKKELYDDWNKGINKFGVITKNFIVKETSLTNEQI